MSRSVPQEFLDELYAIPGNRVSLRYLIEQLEKTGVTVVAGSRISESVGYPRWSDLRRRLGQMAGIQSGDPTPDQIIQASGELFLYDALEENYGYFRSDPSTWKGPIVILPYLTSRIITTNWDSSIEVCFELAGAPSPWIWKMSGTIEDRQSLLIRDTEYDRYRDPLAPVVHAVGETTLLFLGQPYDVLLNVVPRIRLVTGSQAPAYAVVSVKDEIDIGQLSRMSIRAIRCPEFDGQGEELLLRHLADQHIRNVQPATVPLRTFASGPAPLTEIERVADDSGEAPTSSTPEVPADLIQSCLNGECVLFAGAGLSARAGVVTWYRF